MSTTRCPRAPRSIGARLRDLAGWALVALALATTSGTAAEPVPAAPAAAARYHGFLIDGSRIGGFDGTHLDDDHPALARQIALVEDVGVPQEVLAFFRNVPIRVERELPRPPGQFVGGPRGGFVRILADGMAADRPILLHELIHAYHADVVGHGDRDIAQAFEAAKRGSDYPTGFRSAHFLENAEEFFAVTSTIYLFGPVRQPPFDCSVLRATQPAYVAFLAARYGPHDCR